jgi:hypothetical protein
MPAKAVRRVRATTEIFENIFRVERENKGRRDW